MKSFRLHTSKSESRVRDRILCLIIAGFMAAFAYGSIREILLGLNGDWIGSYLYGIPFTCFWAYMFFWALRRAIKN